MGERRTEGPTEDEILAVMKERDDAIEWADRLAYALGGPVIGEHSNLNNPWQNALDEPLAPSPAREGLLLTFKQRANATHERPSLAAYHALVEDLLVAVAASRPSPAREGLREALYREHERRLNGEHHDPAERPDCATCIVLARAALSSPPDSALSEGLIEQALTDVLAEHHAHIQHETSGFDMPVKGIARALAAKLREAAPTPSPDPSPMPSRLSR